MDKKYLEGKFAEVAENFILIGKKSTEDKKYFDEKFSAIDKRFVAIDQKFKKIDGKFEQIDKRFEKIDLTLEEGFAGVYERFDDVIFYIDKRFTDLAKELDLVNA